MKKSDGACRAIRAATTETQVVAAVRDYLESLDPAETAVIPAEIMAFGLSQAEEAIHSALLLVHRQILGGSDSAETAVLNDVTLVFSTAARRMATLAKDVM